MEKKVHVETHLDVLMKNAKEETLEERFLKAKKTFLMEKLAHLQREIDSKRVSEDIGFLLMVLYVFDFIDREARKYADEILNSLSFTGWPLEHFRPLLEKKSLEERIDKGVELNYRGLDPATHSKTVDLVSTLWRELELGRDFGEETRRIVEEKKRLYSMIGSKPDLERRELVKRLASKGGRKIELRLMNIGIVPTELCPNSCRFCLAAWKTGVEERRGRALTEEEFKKIADQAIDFAGEKGIILTITGGEPLLQLERVLYILKKAKSRVDLSTSGFWGGNKREAERVLSKMNKAVNRNKNPGFGFYLQLSLDFFHQEIRLEDGKLKENVPLRNIANIVEVGQNFNINICPLTKFTRYEDPLIHLIIELKKRGLNARLTGKVYDPNLKVGVMDGDKMVIRPALLKADLQLGRGRSIVISYSAVENIGKAKALEAFEFPGFGDRVEKFLKGDSKEKFPLVGLEVSDDGNVYPGAHSLYSWCLGNLLETNLKEIYRLAQYDPLFIALAEEPLKIRDLALEVEPDILEKLKDASSPLVAVYKILEHPAMRLYITKRLIQENDSYGMLKKELGLEVDKEKLKEEYFYGSASD